jgi:hypothetical protein
MLSSGEAGASDLTNAGNCKAAAKNASLLTANAIPTGLYAALEIVRFLRELSLSSE